MHSEGWGKVCLRASSLNAESQNTGLTSGSSNLLFQGLALFGWGRVGATKNPKLKPLQMLNESQLFPDSRSANLCKCRQKAFWTKLSRNEHPDRKYG